MKNIYKENTQIVFQILKKLKALGVNEVCLCPSNRNAPLVAGFTANPDLFKTYLFFEERSASFFALGRIRQSGRPVAVCTTSGTAVGELLPATMEGFYSGISLILISADRPKHYKSSGAPQAAEQVGIFGIYVSHCYDVDCEKDVLKIPEIVGNIPMQWNVRFDEPFLEPDYLKDLNPYHLVSQKESSLGAGSKSLAPKISSFWGTGALKESLDHFNLKRFQKKVRRPFVIVSRLHPDEREAVASLLLEWKVPTYFESLSGLREDSRFNNFRIYEHGHIFERAAQLGYFIDGIVRIGGVPTLRLWRDLDLKLCDIPVLSLSSLPFTGLARGSYLLQGSSWDKLCRKVAEHLSFAHVAEQKVTDSLLLHDRQLYARVHSLILMEPLSEPSLIYQLSNFLPERARVYIGNSSPIREWDLAATEQAKNFEIWASRGLNGIDGQISTFFGFAEPGKQNWAIIGDLTAFYDLPGPWVLQQMKDTSAHLVIMNNGGGKFFSRFFAQKEFQNLHQISFEPWAKLWGLEYERWNEVPKSIQSRSTHRVIEIFPNEEATLRFWKTYQSFF